MRTAALQSAKLISVIIDGSVPCPGSRSAITSKPRACSDSASAFTEYGESVRPWISSAEPCGGSARNSNERLKGASAANRCGPPAGL